MLNEVSRLTLIIGDNSSGKSYIFTDLAQNTKGSILIVDDRTTILKNMDIIAPPDDVTKDFIEMFKRIVQEVVRTSVEVPKELSDVLGLELSIIDNRLYVTMSNG